MKNYSLRTWIIATIVVLILNWVSLAFGPFVCESIVQSGVERDTVYLCYGSLGTLFRMVIGLCFFMLGLFVARDDCKQPLSVWGGWLMATHGIMNMVYAVVIGMSTLILDIPIEGLKLISSVVLSLLLYSSLIIIACYYGRKDLRDIAIVFTVVGVAVRLNDVMSFLIQGECSKTYVGNVLSSLIGMVLCLVYLFLWLKVVNVDTTRQPETSKRY